MRTSAPRLRMPWLLLAALVLLPAPRAHAQEEGAPPVPTGLADDDLSPPPRREIALIAGLLVLGATAAFYSLRRRAAERRAGEMEQLAGELRQAKEALERERTYLRAVIDASPNGIFAKDQDGRYTLASRAMAEFFATVPEGIVGKTPAELGLSPAEVESTLRTDREALTTGRSLTIREYAVTTPGTGEVRWFDTFKVPLDLPCGGRQVLGITVDVTERQQAERLLREQSAAMEGTMDGMAILDERGCYTYANRAHAEVYGCGEPGELIGRNWRELYSGAELERIQDVVMSTLFRTGRWRGEAVGTRLDGSTFPQELSLTALQGGGLVCVVRDTTVRRRMEAQLQAEHSYLERLFEDAPEGIVLVNGEDQVLRANAEFLRMFGYTADEVIGRSLEDLIVPEGKGEEAVRLLQRATTGAPVRAETVRHRKDGSRVDVSILATSVFAREGQVEVFGIYRDISERKQADEALRRSEEHFRAIIENAQDLIAILEADGTIRYESPSITRFVGYTPEDLVGRSAFELIHPEDLPYVLEQFGKVLEHAGDMVYVEFRFRHIDGSWRTLSATGANLLDHPAVRGVVVNSRDVTDERAREERLRRMERLASVGTLVSGVAHELNNPLAAIKSFAQLMQLDERTEEDGEALEIIAREAGRAAKIVSDLRLLARKTQEREHERGPVDLNEVVRHALKLRRYALETRGVRIREELAEHLPRVSAVRADLEQIALNLLTNAEHALAEQEGEKVLIVRTRPSRLGSVLHVADNGPGIPEEHLAQIFDPFFTTKAPGEGTGLGLSLVHQMVVENEGEIRVESELGKGACFTVDLPRATTPKAVTVPEGPGASAPTPGLRILVVDDEESIRRSLARYFGRRGHRVEVAAEGGEAIRLMDATAAGEPYDVILSDFRMPGLGGEKLLDCLRERGSELVQSLVFITGDAASPEADRVLSSAGVPVVLKPFELERLAELLERHGTAHRAERAPV